MRPVLTAIWFVVVSFYTMVMIFLSYLWAPTGRKAWWFAREWARMIIRVAGVHVHVERAEPLVPGQPYVFMSNHASNLDVLCLAPSLPDMAFVAKNSLRHIPIVGWGMVAARMIFIDRSNRTQAMRTLGAAVARIRGGLCVSVFPEGTRSRDGKLGPFKKGVFHLAAAAQVPIVPIAVLGTSELLPVGSGLIRSGEVTMRIGRPIPVPQGMPVPELMARVRTELEALMAAPIASVAG